ncbi:hypothetical protein PGH44_11240 [Legionella pneumophila]|nr:hypothetical protein PGH44_11240 [Legionella pneumophila]
MNHKGSFRYFQSKLTATVAGLFLLNTKAEQASLVKEIVFKDKAIDISPMRLNISNPFAYYILGTGLLTRSTLKHGQQDILPHSTYTCHFL